MNENRMNVKWLVICAVSSVMFLICAHYFYYEVYEQFKEIQEICQQEQDGIISAEESFKIIDEIDAQYSIKIENGIPYALISILGMVIGFIMSCIAWRKGQQKYTAWGIGVFFVSIIIVAIELIVFFCFVK